MSSDQMIVAVLQLGIRVLASRIAVFLGILGAVGLFIAALALQTWMALAVASAFAIVVLWPLLMTEGRRNES